MITEIGIVAGDIWHCLDRNGEQTLTEMVQKTEKDRDLILMGLGWLGREGHVIIEPIGTDYKCALRARR